MTGTNGNYKNNNKKKNDIERMNLKLKETEKLNNKRKGRRN